MFSKHLPPSGVCVRIKKHIFFIQGKNIWKKNQNMYCQKYKSMPNVCASSLLSLLLSENMIATRNFANGEGVKKSKLLPFLSLGFDLIESKVSLIQFIKFLHEATTYFVRAFSPHFLCRLKRKKIWFVKHYAKSGIYCVFLSEWVFNMT